MNSRCTVARESGSMRFRGVPFVDVKPVSVILFCVLHHPSVPRNLGDDACGHDGRLDMITSDYGGAWWSLDGGAEFSVDGDL